MAMDFEVELVVVTSTACVLDWQGENPGFRTNSKGNFTGRNKAGFTGEIPITVL